MHPDTQRNADEPQALSAAGDEEEQRSGPVSTLAAAGIQSPPRREHTPIGGADPLMVIP
jgi:hypothetical protein